MAAPQPDSSVLDRTPVFTLGHRMLWEAVIEIGPRIELGRGPHGNRRRIDILGGCVRGGVEVPGLRGRVLAGGSDRQLDRQDGARELDALYDIEIDDGTVLTLRNRVIIDERPERGRYAMSHIEVQAPEGPWSWLSRRIIVGTLQSQRPTLDAVVIRAFEIRAAG
ncbi:DUF3237 family protein [Salipiger sp. H15]|uniref:DUF3237 family protein n=1 Tax=Alloyangia sp. H15 TaxID=3029062 RepID=A0AAU8ALU9_9RHOB